MEPNGNVNCLIYERHLIGLRRENNSSEERGICRTGTDKSAKYVSAGIEHT